MSEKVDWIWYENATRPATEKPEPSNLKQSPDTRRHQPQEPSATQAEKVKSAQAKTTG